MPMSRVIARRDRLAPSAARWRRATALISSIISARTRARMEAAGMVRVSHKTRALLLTVRAPPVSIVLNRERCSRFEPRRYPVSHHVIVGAGPVGSATALLLAERGEKVVLVPRSGKGPDDPRITRVAADATHADRLVELTTGSAVLYNCANPQYHQWFTDW